MGKDLIRNAELKTVISDRIRIETAVNTFVSKYDGLPGDLINATNYWPADTSNHCSQVDICDNPALTTINTCNGNGDGLIGDTSNSLTEIFRFWQHLANANLISGAYTGRNCLLLPALDLSIMPGRIPSSKYYIAYANSSYGYYFPAFANHHMMMVYGFPGYNYLFSSQDALMLDKKTDDGLPGTGQTLADPNSGCATSTNPAIAVYTPNGTSVVCDIEFIMGF